MGIFQTAQCEVFAAFATERIGLITADTGLTGKENAPFVHDELRVGHLLALKDNQSVLHGEAVARVSELGAAAARATTRERIGKARHLRRVWLARLADRLVDREHARTLVRVEYWERVLVTRTGVEVPSREADDTPGTGGNWVSAEPKARNRANTWKYCKFEQRRDRPADTKRATEVVTKTRSWPTAGHLNLVPWRSRLDRLIGALRAALPHDLDGRRWPPALLATLP